MKKKPSLAVIIVASILSSPLWAGERTIPVDFFLMIDKSLSMAEPGKFQNLQEWVQEDLLGQKLIDGDWITIYDFYGKTDHLLTLTVASAEDRRKITRAIAGITPDGKYTDIGLALDTMKDALAKRDPNDRLKIMLLLTDLKQEAPWSSRYAGTADKFDSPYLAEARQIKHGEWYEITLDMDIQDAVVATTKSLFGTIAEQEAAGTPKILPEEGLTADGTGSGIAGDGKGDNGSGDATGDRSVGTKVASGGKAAPGDSQNGARFGLGTLPLIPSLVVGSVVFLGGCALLVRGAINNRRRKEENRTKETV
jgi:hypothetical protein